MTSLWIAIWQEGERLPRARCCAWLTFWRPGCLLVVRPSARLQASAGALCFYQCSVSSRGRQGLCSGVCSPSDSSEVAGFFPLCFLVGGFVFLSKPLIQAVLATYQENPQVFKRTLCFEWKALAQQKYTAVMLNILV